MSISPITSKGAVRQRVGPRATVPERLAFHTRLDDNGCWIWQGDMNSRGYGRIVVNSVRHFVHRLSYETHVGPIPSGMVIDHLCRTPLCCNPSHLEPVTSRENMLRGEAPHAVTMRTGQCANGHDYETHGRIDSRGKRFCGSCKDTYMWLWRHTPREVIDERRAAGLPAINLAAHFSDEAA